MKTNKNEMFYLNTNLLPICSVAMYGTILSPTEFEEAENDWRRFEGEEEVEVDYELYHTILCEEAGNYIEEEVLPRLQEYGGQNFTNGDIDSPRYYNFENDELTFYLEMKPDWRETMSRKMQELRADERCAKYIREHYHSRDGFWSFMPGSFDEIEAQIITCADIHRAVAAYLTLCLLHDDALERYDDEFRSDYILYERLQERSGEFLVPAQQEVAA